jgi:hypothetical protein
VREQNNPIPLTDWRNKMENIQEIRFHGSKRQIANLKAMAELINKNLQDNEEEVRIVDIAKASDLYKQVRKLIDEFNASDTKHK